MPSTTPGRQEPHAGPRVPDGRDGDRLRPGPRRRAVLAGTAGALFVAGTTAGCTDDAESPAQRRARVDAARRLRRAAADDSESLLSRYTSTAAVHPALGGLLAPLREAVARHVEVFGETGTARGRRDDAPAGGTDGPGGGAGAPGSGGPGNKTAVPGDEGRALAVLADAERRTADARMRALADAPPELARLLASVAAAGSTHAFLLAKGDAE
jgi:hypothetical protein